MDIPDLKPTAVLVDAARHRLPAHAGDEDVLALISGHYARASPDLWVPGTLLRPVGLVRHEAGRHPRRIGYRVPALVRTVAHLQQRPGWVADGFSAATLHGFGLFSDQADTMLLGNRNRTFARSPEQATVRRLHGLVRPQSRRVHGRTLLTVDRGTAIAHCLRDIRSGSVSWPVTRGLKFSDASIRVIQFLDHVRERTGMTAAEIGSACTGLIDARWLAGRLASTSEGMESPPETLLRLILRQHMPRAFEPQVDIRDGGMLITRADQADRERRVAVFYDGEHHLDRRQRDRDTAVTRALHRQGWAVVRLTVQDVMDAARTVDAIRVVLQHHDPRTRSDYVMTRSARARGPENYSLGA